MVPCQPRQLVIFSLPFAALVAFFWFRRRRSLSRSDPGGTLVPPKQVDRRLAASSNEEQKPPVSKNEAADVVKSVAEPAAVAVDKSADVCIAPVEIKKIVCNGATAHVKEEPEVKKTSSKESKDITTPEVETNGIFHSSVIEDVEEDREVKKILSKESEDITTPEVETNGIFHSSVIEDVQEDREVKKILSKESEDIVIPEVETDRIFHSSVIEDNIDFEKNQLNFPSETQKPIVETVDRKQECQVESVYNINTTGEEIKEKEQVDTQVEENIHEKSVVEENIESETTLIAEPDSAEAHTEEEISIPFEDQSTLENPFTKKTVENTCSAKTLERVSPVDYSFAESDLNSSKDVSELREDTSTDTGVGSQDESQASMAQGQTSEQKAERDGAGLEQKLASLGLDTQQPARDSANHSPAEVMLNSPAISTFSDAHSEGSSDSGKGCSDVVTPPSRTPAGGSSVAGDHAPSSYEFVLPQVIVGRLIGRHGTFLHDIRAKTHTNVFIKKHPETNTLKICAIEGAQPDIDAALKMIRQKFPLRRFPDLTLERVSFVKNSALPISPENLQLHLVEGVNNDVIVSSLISAGHMFLQMPMHISYQSLYRLACIMNSVYTTQDSPPLPDPQPDVVCVAPAHGGWYRAQILSVDEDNNTSDIRFLDYGGFVTVDNSLLRQIRGDFLLLPFQAVECALANVVPTGGEEEWSDEAKQFVQLMTTQQTLQAQVYEYTETGVPLVYLYSTQFYQSPADPTGFETKVVLLNEELVSRGYADLIDAIPEDVQTHSTETS